MAAVVDNAVDANQFHARVAEVLHQLLCVPRTEVGRLQLLVLLLCVLQRNEVLGQLFGLERLCNGRPANRTDRQLFLLEFDEALLAEGVAAV